MKKESDNIILNGPTKEVVDGDFTPTKEIVNDEGLPSKELVNEDIPTKEVVGEESTLTKEIVDEENIQTKEVAKKILSNYCGFCGHHFDNQTDKYCPVCGGKREEL